MKTKKEAMKIKKNSLTVGQNLSKCSQANFSTKKGFTLVETLIAIFVFSLVTVMISGVFASFLKNYAESRKTLHDVEDGQFAMNLIAKTLRTSDVKVESASVLKVYDFSQAKCLKYSFAGSKIQVNYSTEPAGKGSVANCTFPSMVGAKDLTAASVTNVYFNVKPSDTSAFGFVVVALTIKDATQTSAPMHIQMVTSLRNLN